MSNQSQELDRFSENPVGGFPLTDGDLVALAETWWDVVIDNDLFRTLSGTFGSEWREIKLAAARLDLVEERLGPDAVQRIRDRTEEHWRRRVGEECWRAYKAGEPLLQTEAAERSAKRAERAGRGDAASPCAADAVWSTAETRAVDRAIAADPDVAASWREFVAELRHAPDAFPSRGVVRETLACGLREEAAQAVTSLAPGLLSDLADLALARVDWPELAEKLLSEIEGAATPKNHETGSNE